MNLCTRSSFLPPILLSLAVAVGACSNANGTDASGTGKKNNSSSENAEADDPSPSQSPADADPIGAEPIAERDFCTSLTLAHCEAAQACCTDEARKYAGLTQCVQQYEAPCDLAYQAPDGAETLRAAQFDPEAAGVELARYRNAAARCGAAYEVNFDALFEDGAFRTHCNYDAECPSGAVCERDFGSTCYFATRMDGERCQSTEACGPSKYCSAPKHPFFTDEDDDPSTDSTNDDADPGTLDLGNLERVCATGKRVKGSACVHDECPRELYCRGSMPDGQLAYGWTKGECSTRAKNGESCFQSSDCRSGVCAGSPSGDWTYAQDGDMVTATPPAPGHCVACGADDCGLSACDEGVCVWDTPRRDKQDGASCDDDRECESGWCVSGICLTPEANDLYCPN